MSFSVSNDWIQWTLDIGPDSVSIAVNDLDQNLTISSQEIPLAAWQLLLSQRQEFLNNHLPRVPITENQEGTMEMRDKVLSIVGAQDLDTSSYQVSDLEDIEFNWENPQLRMLLQQHPSLSDPQNLPGCREVALLEKEWKMYPIMFLESCFVKYYCVCVLISLTCFISS